MSLTLSYLSSTNYQEGECYLGRPLLCDKSGGVKSDKLPRGWSMKKRSEFIAALLFACLGIWVTAVRPATAQAPAAAPAPAARSSRRRPRSRHFLFQLFVLSRIASHGNGTGAQPAAKSHSSFRTMVETSLGRSLSRAVQRSACRHSLRWSRNRYRISPRFCIAYPAGSRYQASGNRVAGR